MRSRKQAIQDGWLLVACYEHSIWTYIVYDDEHKVRSEAQALAIFADDLPPRDRRDIRRVVASRVSEMRQVELPGLAVMMGKP